MYAIIKTGGKQYRIAPGEVIKCELLKAGPGEVVEFGEVLLVKDESGLKVGSPYIEGCKVTGKVLRVAKGRKVLVFKYKRRKGYKKLRGHRQWETTVRIQDIILN